MRIALALMTSWPLLVAQTPSTRPADVYREEFKLQSDKARISQEFASDAWIGLLYASRMDSHAEIDSLGEHRIEAKLESLRSEVRTDGEWLFWFRLKRYSLATASSEDLRAVSSMQIMRDTNACRSALMVALRSRVMKAEMPDCEAPVRFPSKHKP